MTMKKLVIYGAGAGSREILQAVRDAARHTTGESPAWQPIAFVDDDPSRHGTRVDDLPVAPSLEALDDRTQLHVVCGVMNPKVRRKVYLERAAALGMPLATILHPAATVSPDLRCGPGTVVMPGARVGFEVVLGQGAFVLWNVVLGHNLQGGDFVTVLSGAVVTGGCTLDDDATIGAGAVLNVGTRVGRNSLVGVGTTVMRDVPDNTTVVSTPRQTTLPR